MEPTWRSDCGAVELYLGDCRKVLPSVIVDAVVTSPPYAMQRAKQYGGIQESDYPAWTCEWMGAVPLAVGGSVFVNIREHVRDGVMSDYVHRTRMAVRDAGWIECDELIWLKRNAMPTGDPARPRRSWERVLWFANKKHPTVYPKNAGKPMLRHAWSGEGVPEWSNSKAKLKPAAGVSRVADVIDVSLGYKKVGHAHPAAYPPRLAEWLVNLATAREMVVCDPFAGSGTTALACINAGRRFVGCEINPAYLATAKQRIQKALADKAELLVA